MLGFGWLATAKLTVPHPIRQLSEPVADAVDRSVHAIQSGSELHVRRVHTLFNESHIHQNRTHVVQSCTDNSQLRLDAVDEHSILLP